MAAPNIVLNTIVAEAFCEACDILEKAENFDEAVHDLIKQYASEHHRIVFNGKAIRRNGWRKQSAEAFPNIRSMVGRDSRPGHGQSH